jgi:hypothetical protein
MDQQYKWLVMLSLPQWDTVPVNENLLQPQQASDCLSLKVLFSSASHLLCEPQKASNTKAYLHGVLYGASVVHDHVGSQIKEIQVEWSDAARLNRLQLVWLSDIDQQQSKLEWLSDNDLLGPATIIIGVTLTDWQV